MSANEEWVPIVGFEKSYQVSTFGNVRSLDRIGGNNRRLKGQVILPQSSGKGYLQVNLYKNGNKKAYYIHRLVAEHFLENEQNKKEVNHKNGDKTNNVATNLEWSTRSENLKHAFEHGLNDQERNKKPVAKLSIEGETLRMFSSLMEAEKECGINRLCIARCCSGNQSLAGGFLWKFL